jgi:uncharacterized protein YqgC (DUF456 family)
MPSDPIWWLALTLQLLALPGTVLPVLPGLLWLPVGAGVWCWRVGWSVGWPGCAFGGLLFAIGLVADLLAVGLATARMQASRWTGLGAAVGLVLGLLAGGIGILIGPWLGASAVEFWSLQRLPIDQAMSGYRPLKAQLGQAAQVGLAVVFGLLVSQAVQLLMAVLGAVGFIWMTGR